VPLSLIQRPEGGAESAFAATGVPDGDSGLPGTDSLMSDACAGPGLDTHAPTIIDITAAEVDEATGACVAGSALAAPTAAIGRYLPMRLLGEGGLGAVYEAWDPVLSRKVALKTLQFGLDLPARESLDALFLNEARAAAGLSHRHIVTVHDAGLSPHGAYIAMERLRGRDLRQALQSGWRPSAQEAARLVRRIADALAYAHARGVTHCDIKPANIFLTRHDRPKVLDFGIARIAHRAAPAAIDGLVAGSPHHLAPEQLRGGEVDARTDLYALGTVLYELLTGAKAFDGDSLDAIVGAVLNDPPPDAHERFPEVPSALSAIAWRAMAKRPDERFASAAEMAHALRHWQAIVATPPAAAGVQPARTARRRSGPTAWAAAVALLAVGGGAWWTVAGVPDKPSPGMAGTAPGSVAAGDPGAQGLATLAVATPAAASRVAPPGADEAEPQPAAQRGAGDARSQPPAPPAAGPGEPRPATPTARPPAARAKKPAATPPPMPTPEPAAAVAPAGVVHIAISPWGQVEVDGRSAGTAPPLTRLELPAGAHTITVRNEDFPPHVMQVHVDPDKPVTVRHRFGS
jgi:serine/threonine-protein kinase